MPHHQTAELNVTFLGCSKDPIDIIYSAYHIDRSKEEIIAIWQQIQEKGISREEMEQQLPKGLIKTLPPELRQAHFVFMVDNISRISALSLHRFSIETDKPGLICTDQFRHSGDHLAVTPPSFQKHRDLQKKWSVLQSEMIAFYKACCEKGIDPEDAGFALPRGLLCREQISMSFQVMQQFLDIKMCEHTHWEIRNASRQIYRWMKREFPTLARRLGIKCWENRNLFCDEPYDLYKSCRLHSTRPHKRHLTGILSDPVQPDRENLTV